MLAGAIAYASQSILPPIFGVKIQPVVVPSSGTGPSHGVNSTSGTLLVRVTSSFKFLSNLIATPYMQGVGVSVVPVGSGPLFPKTYPTNSTGEVELNLTPSNYSVSFFDLPMNFSVPVVVYESMTTEVQLTVTGDTYQGIFLSIPTNQTDVAPAWSHGTIEVDSSMALLGMTAAFLDLYYGSSGASSTSSNATANVGTPVQTPLVITGSAARSSGPIAAPEFDEWVSFQPESAVALAGVTSVGLSVYGAYTNVTTYSSMTTTTGGASSGL